MFWDLETPEITKHLPVIYFSAAQVTALNVVNEYLYIGNTRGRIIVADALSMKPLCVFPAHSPREFYVKCILPVLGEQDSECDETDMQNLSQGLVSVGRGYIDMLSQGGGNTKKEINAGGRGKTQSGPLDGFAHHTFLLSWSTQDWEYYWSLAVWDFVCSVYLLFCFCH